MVGLDSDFQEVVCDLIELDYDAIAAYQTAIERLENSAFKAKLGEFLRDHERHVEELSVWIRQQGATPPDGPDMKKVLTTGKVVMADMFGDKAILMAMKTNEEDTNTAYERALEHDNLPITARDLISRNLADERRHRAWIVATLDSF
jgi:uncharacterized protein (TIGR02284 family)